MYENLFAERGLSLERLRAFLEVAEAGGIARAVRDDPVRQSQYSRQIGELEAYFGVRLVQRRGRHLALTDAGREFAAAVRAQFQSLEDFRRRCREEAPVITIGAGDSILTWLIIPRLPGIREAHPDLTVKLANLRSASIAERLAEFQLDFGVARRELLLPPLAVETLGRVAYRLFVPERWLAKGKRPALSALPLVTLGSDGEFVGRLLREATTAGLKLQVPLVTESFPQAARAVESGEFAGVLPEFAGPDLARKGIRSFGHAVLRKLGRTLALGWNPRLDRLRVDLQAVRSSLIAALKWQPNDDFVTEKPQPPPGRATKP